MKLAWKQQVAEKFLQLEKLVETLWVEALGSTEAVPDQQERLGFLHALVLAPVLAQSSAQIQLHAQHLSLAGWHGLASEVR